MNPMDEHQDDGPPFPQGYEPPTDVDVPWYAWVVWPIAIIAAICVTTLLFRGCMTFVS